MDSFCGAVLNFLKSGAPVVLATMMDHSGSVPRAAGARMLVRPDGGIWGTVGGGRYEAEAIALAMRMLGEQTALRDSPAGQPGAVIEFSLRGVTDMDMICGGALSLLLEVISPDSRTLELFQAGRAAERAAKAFVFVSRFERAETEFTLPASISSSSRPVPAGAPVDTIEAGLETPVRVERSLFFPQSGLVLPQGVAIPEAALTRARTLTNATPCHLQDQGSGYLLELFARPYRIIIFGGGHVSRELVVLCSRLDFPVTVLDDRPEFANAERFPNAEVLVPPTLAEADAEACLRKLRIDQEDGIVIVTRGHAHDRDVLAAALRTNAGYIGMIGSKSKRAAVYASLRETGVSSERLESVYSPIGLAIGADTPQEIAVSIAAELIQWRRRQRDARKFAASNPATVREGGSASMAESGTGPKQDADQGSA